MSKDSAKNDFTIMDKKDELTVACKKHLIEIRKLIKNLEKDLDGSDFEKQLSAICFIGQWLKLTWDLINNPDKYLDAENNN